MADIALNVGAEALPQTRQTIIEQSQELGVDQAGLANVIGVAISAGANDLQEAISVSSAALKLTAGDAQKAVALVGGALDVASLAQSKNFEGALGQIAQVQSQVRATDAALFAANIGRGIAAATADQTNVAALTTEQSFEFASVISQVLKDPTGATTATALRDLVVKVDNFTSEINSQFNDAKTLQERIDIIRSDRGLQTEFLSSVENSEAKIAIKEIVTGSARAIALEQKAGEAITSLNEAGGTFKDLATAVASETSVLAAQRQTQAAIQASQVSGGIEGQIVQTLQDTLDNVNLSGIDTIARSALDASLQFGELTGKPLAQNAIDVLEQAKQQARTQTGLIPGLDVAAGGQVSQRDIAQIDKAIETIGRLAGVLEQQQTQPDTKKQVAVIGAQMRQGEGNP